MHKAIDIINKWSNEADIPINFRKNGILNIIKNTNTPKIVIYNNCINYLLVHRYLETLLYEKLKSEIRLKYYKPKISYLISRFRKIPKNL